jgi:cytochrome c oxidase subunit 2
MQPGSGIQLFPVSASNFSPHVDALMAFWLGVSLFFGTIICVGLVWLAFRYRRRAPDEVGADIGGNVPLEVAWMVIPFILTMVMFAWGADLFVQERTPPPQSQEIYVVGKQWMWKVQHPEGRKEINELHVPLGRPIELVMASEDVIHDFFVPSFRVKEDVVPGKYTTLWFNATKTGKYHFFCSQYCGTNHALMNGWVYVLEPADYAAWLSGQNSGEGTVSMADSGQKLFTQLACQTCHLADGKGRGPSLVGVYGSAVKLSTGQTVLADDGYIRESILQPNAKIVEGYQPLMPTFQGLVTEDQLIQLMAYVKSLAPSATGVKTAPGAAASTSHTSGSSR